MISIICFLSLKCLVTEIKIQYKNTNTIQIRKLCNLVNMIHLHNLCLFTSFRMDMVHLPGKGSGGRRVPLILSPNVVSAMELLAEKRECCSIPTSNVYFFATPSTNGYINGWQVMQDVAVAAQLKHPQLIHSTRLRKYVATVSQVNTGYLNIFKLQIIFRCFQTL